MRNFIDIDHVHSRAIVREIGERLGALLKPAPELPEGLKMQINRLRELDRHQSFQTRTWSIEKSSSRNGSAEQG